VIRVANAPVSFGAFEITVGIVPGVPSGVEVLAAISGAGYEGTELGPPGYLGDRDTLGPALARHGLELVGAYVPLALSQADPDLGELAATLELFDAAGARGARPVLADAGSDERGRLPGRAANDRALGLDEAGWRTLADGVAGAARLARSRGYEPTFHHHAGTYVEAPWEIERLLELTDVGLVLDTGHLLLGGGDPVAGLRDWRARIDHVHVKDCRLAVLESVIAEGADMETAWRRGVFCELGTGDVDLDAFVRELAGYEGWLVVEQDRIPAAGEEASEAAAAQARNRAWLHRHARI
jgi:inosose dehydratase